MYKLNWYTINKDSCKRNQEQIPALGFFCWSFNFYLESYQESTTRIGTLINSANKIIYRKPSFIIPSLFLKPIGKLPTVHCEPQSTIRYLDWPLAHFMALRRTICIVFPLESDKRLLIGNLSPENGLSKAELVFNLIKTDPWFSWLNNKWAQTNLSSFVCWLRSYNLYFSVTYFFYQLQF